MIVGEKNIDWKVIKRCLQSPTSLIHYCDSLIPPALQHVPAIKDNQRYYVALRIRGSKAIPWYHKMEFCKVLTNGIQVKGVMDEVYDYHDIVAAINADEYERCLDADATRRP